MNKAGDYLTDVSGYYQQDGGCLMQLGICRKYENKPNLIISYPLSLQLFRQRLPVSDNISK